MKVVVVNQYDVHGRVIYPYERDKLSVYNNESGYLIINEIIDGKPKTIAVHAPNTWKCYETFDRWKLKPEDYEYNK